MMMTIVISHSSMGCLVCQSRPCAMQKWLTVNVQKQWLECRIAAGGIE